MVNLEAEPKYDPKILYISTTENCNFNCVHCNINENNESGSKYIDVNSTIKKVKFFIKSFKNLYFVHVSGGEPLLSKSFLDLWKELYLLGEIKLILSTNLSLLTDDIIELLKKYPPVILNSSLYGYSDDSFNTFTRSDSRKSVLENLKLLKGILKSRIVVKIPLTDSIFKELNQIITLCNNLGIEYRLIPIILPPKGKNLDSFKSLLVDKHALHNLLSENLLKNINREEIDDFLAQLEPSSRSKIRNCTMQNQIYIDESNSVKNCIIHHKSVDYSENASKLLNNLNDIYTKTYESLSNDCRNCEAYNLCTLCPPKIAYFDKIKFNYKNYYCYIFKSLLKTLEVNNG